MAQPQPGPARDELRDALREWAGAQARLADAIGRYLDAQEPRPQDRGPRMQIVR